MTEDILLIILYIMGLISVITIASYIINLLLKLEKALDKYLREVGKGE